MQKAGEETSVCPEDVKIGRTDGAKAINISRRDVMKGLGLTAIAEGLGRRVLAESARITATNVYPKVVSATGDPVQASISSPFVETEYGRIRGYVRNGIHTFKNIPYGADTSGANRFMPPKKPAEWTGVRPCLHHGYVSPQPARTAWANQEEAWLFDWDDGVQSEDCLNLNVWTPALDSGKRPVMVWLHGGGFMIGHALELPCYDGEDLAHRGVVLVSVTHRLNVFGYLNLAAFGEQYAASGNAGMLDLVAALEWVRDNISRFGGDPNRVTIFGQSGGGGKVSTLMAMPAAKGLFHRAIVESGSFSSTATMENSNAAAAKVMKLLSIDGANVNKLQQISINELERVGTEVSAWNVAPRTGAMDFRRPGMMPGWAPVSGNTTLPETPFDPRAPEISASVPMIIGNTLNETVQGMDKPDAFKMTHEELKSNVRNLWKDKAEEVINTFRKSFPNANNFQLWSVIGASPVRAMTLQQVRRKVTQNAAPAYCYRFDWQTPVLDGRILALHCAELPFVFDTTARWENLTGNGPAARALAAKMSEAWVHFAASGDPNHPGIPHWKPFDPATNGTMVFDNECVFREHLDDECQKVING